MDRNPRQEEGRCANADCTKGNLPLGQLKRCTQCKTALYCTPECQKKHWPAHKAACSRIALNNTKAQALKNDIEEACRTLDPSKDLPTILTCCICLQMWVDPAMTHPCQHIFCRECQEHNLEASTSKVLKCPLCRKPVEGFNPMPREVRLAVFTFVLDKMPENATAWYNLGCAVSSYHVLAEGESRGFAANQFTYKGEVFDSMSCFIKALSLNHEFGKAWMKLGMEMHNHRLPMKMVNGRTYSVIDCIRFAVGYNPNLVDAWCYLGDMMQADADRLAQRKGSGGKGQKKGKKKGEEDPPYSVAIKGQEHTVPDVYVEALRAAFRFPKVTFQHEVKRNLVASTLGMLARVMAQHPGIALQYKSDEYPPDTVHTMCCDLIRFAQRGRSAIIAADAALIVFGCIPTRKLKLSVDIDGAALLTPITVTGDVATPKHIFALALTFPGGEEYVMSTPRVWAEIVADITPRSGTITIGKKRFDSESAFTHLVKLSERVGDVGMPPCDRNAKPVTVSGNDPDKQPLKTRRCMAPPTATPTWLYCQQQQRPSPAGEAAESDEEGEEWETCSESD